MSPASSAHEAAPEAKLAPGLSAPLETLLWPSPVSRSPGSLAKSA